MARWSLRPPFRLRLNGALSVSGDVAYQLPAEADLGALRFYVNSPSTLDDFARLTELPASFGTGEFTFEMWIRLDDERSVGTAGGTNHLVWSNANPTKYSSSDWWWAGNFLLDGHNNNAVQNGTFSFQIINANGADGADIRWTFGDGDAADARTGDLHAVQTSGLQLRDNNWHHVAAVRRWDADTGAVLELWVDGVKHATETTTARTNMRTWWDSWSGFPTLQTGWHFGGEKRSITDEGPYWDDYSGDLTEIRFYNYAKTETDLQLNWSLEPVPGASGLVGWFRCGELDGSNRTYDELAPAGSGTPRYITVTPRSQGPAWVEQRPPEGSAQTLTSLTLHPSATGTLPYMATLYPLEGEVPAGRVISSPDDVNMSSTVLSTWPDGSAQVVTIAGATSVTNNVTKTLALRAVPPSGDVVTPARVGALISSIAVNFGAVGSGSLSDFSSPDFVWWANGAVGCFRYRIAIGSDMEAIIDVHAFAAVDRAFVEFVIENGKVDANASSVSHPSTKTYSNATLAVTPVGGSAATIATVSSPSNGMSSPRTRPSEVISYSGGHEPSRAWYAAGWVNGSTASALGGAADPGVEVTHDPAYLQQHPWFWKPLEPTNKSLQSFYSQSYDTYQPWAGCRNRFANFSAGSDDEAIAMFPEVDCDYFQSGNRFVRRAVIANGLAHLSWNFNWRHSGSGAYNGRVPGRSQLVGKSSSDGGSGNWPRITTAPRYGGHTFDGSHIPATTLVPFLCQPSPCFIELAQKNLTWNHTNYGSSNGWHEYDQVRSRAWRNRNYAIATFLTPDWDATRKAEYRTVLAVNAQNILRFFPPNKPWNTFNLMWQHEPDYIEHESAQSAGYSKSQGWPQGTNIESPSFQHWFCAWSFDAISRVKVARDQAQTDWNSLADKLATIAPRIVNDAVDYSAPGVWRMQDIDIFIGQIGSSPHTLVQPSNLAQLWAQGKTGTPPTSFSGTWLNGEPQAGGSDNWQSMGEDNISFGYSAQFFSCLGIACERGVSGADLAWERVYTNNGISNFQTWRTNLRPTPRFNRFPRNKPDTKVATALSTAAGGLSSNAFVAFDGAGLTTTSTHPTRGTTCAPLSDGKSNSSYQILGWAGKGCYDPVTRRALFMGCGASDGSLQNSAAGAYSCNTMPIYSETANSNAGQWSATRAFRAPGESTNARAIGHVYDGNAIDLVNRRLYKMKFGDNGEAYIYVYDLDSDTLTASIPWPSGTRSQQWGSLEFVPTRGSNGKGALWFAGYANADGLRVWEYDLDQYPGGSTWSVVIANATFGGNNTMHEEGLYGPTMSFNPRANSGAGGVMIGHRDGCWTATTQPGTVSLTSRSLPAAGVRICQSPSGFCRDPVGDGWLRITTSNVYRFSGSSWSARNPSVPGGITGDYLVIPIDTYGVVWVLQAATLPATDANGFLYKP